MHTFLYVLSRWWLCGIVLFGPGQKALAHHPFRHYYPEKALSHPSGSDPLARQAEASIAHWPDGSFAAEISNAIVRYNPKGQEQNQWQIRSSTPHLEAVEHLMALPEGKLLALGQSAGKDGPAQGNHAPEGQFTSDLWLTCWDSTGQLLWQKMLGGSGEEVFLGAKINTKGQVLLWGSAESQDGDLAELPADDLPWVLALNSQGQVLFQKRMPCLAADFQESRQGWAVLGPDSLRILQKSNGAKIDAQAHYLRADSHQSWWLQARSQDYLLGTQLAPSGNAGRCPLLLRMDSLGHVRDSLALCQGKNFESEDHLLLSMRQSGADYLLVSMVFHADSASFTTALTTLPDSGLEKTTFDTYIKEPLFAEQVLLHGQSATRLPNGKIAMAGALGSYLLSPCTLEPRFNYQKTGELAVAFSETSQGHLLEWAWDFDGEGFSTNRNPTFRFPKPGRYRVCFRAVSLNNCVEVYCREVEVGLASLVPTQKSGAISLSLTASMLSVSSRKVLRAQLLNSRGQVVWRGKVPRGKSRFPQNLRPGVYWFYGHTKEGTRLQRSFLIGP